MPYFVLLYFNIRLEGHGSCAYGLHVHCALVVEDDLVARDIQALENVEAQDENLVQVVRMEE